MEIIHSDTSENTYGDAYIVVSRNRTALHVLKVSEFSVHISVENGTVQIETADNNVGNISGGYYDKSEIADLITLLTHVHSTMKD